MVGLIDLDSLLYKAVYKIVSIDEVPVEITELGEESENQWMLEQAYNKGINRCENSILQIQNYLEGIFFEEITEIELFITTCTKNFRHDIVKDYKKNRKKNDYVWLLREHYKNNFAFHSDTVEADDLIADRCDVLGPGNYIIISPDKDMKTIGGYYWSYYKQDAKDINGNKIKNEGDGYEQEFKHKSVDFITKREAELFFYSQMLIGDRADSIKGVSGLGVVKTKELLKDANNYFITVARQYLKRDLKSQFWQTYRLLKLGTP
jgi:5'-3' exonuclease